MFWHYCTTYISPKKNQVINWYRNACTMMSSNGVTSDVDNRVVLRFINSSCCCSLGIK